MRSAATAEIVVASVLSRRKKPPGGITPYRSIWRSPSPDSLQPSSEMDAAPGLYNSIHSSVEKACVPAQATSLIRTEPGANEEVGRKGRLASPGVGQSPYLRTSSPS